MVRFRGRSLPTGQGRLARLALVLLSLLILGCADRTMRDAGAAVLDAPGVEDDASKTVAPNLDARIGLGGGAACDASEQCLSGGCALGICSDWTHVMKIGIDTTSTGADVGMVHPQTGDHLEDRQDALTLTEADRHDGGRAHLHTTGGEADEV